MSDAGDEIPVAEAPVEVAVADVAPKGKLSVEDALQVWFSFFLSNTQKSLICVKFI